MASIATRSPMPPASLSAWNTAVGDFGVQRHMAEQVRRDPRGHQTRPIMSTIGSMSRSIPLRRANTSPTITSNGVAPTVAVDVAENTPSHQRSGQRR